MTDNFEHITFEAHVPVEIIYSDPAFNCRGLLDQTRLMELADSIKNYGLQLPILIQPFVLPEPYKYRIVAGHRRYAACATLLGWTTIPALVNFKELSNEETQFLNLVENINRQDLTQLEAAFILQRFVDNGYSCYELASKLHKSIGWIQAQLTILELNPAIQTQVIDSRLNIDNIDYLASFPLEEQEAIFKALKQGKHIKSKRETRPYLRRRPKRNDVIIMMGQLMKSGLDFAARTLAWASGLISSEVFEKEIKNECKTNVPD